MDRSSRPFIDWLKCFGMMLILYGHLAGWAPLASVGPIYSKQFGVAFFLFATAYSLTRETRSRAQVVFNRLFDVYLFGIAVALVVSTVSMATGGRPQLSNYYPFMGGMNVVMNHFPANPTSWYVATYLHVIVLWGLIGGRFRVSVAALVVAATAETAIRAILMETAGRYVAYMTIPNWATVLMLGCWFGQHEQPGDRSHASDRKWPFIAGSAAALVLAAIVWTWVSSQVPIERTFPFMRVTAAHAWTGALFVSSTVTVLYAGATLLVFQTFRRVRAPALVTFVSRNTLLIFLLHMPLFYAMEPIVAGWTTNRALRSTIYLVLCLPGLAIVSEILRRVVRPRELRARVYARMLGGRVFAAPLDRRHDSPISDVQ